MLICDQRVYPLNYFLLRITKNPVQIILGVHMTIGEIAVIRTGLVTARKKKNNSSNKEEDKEKIAEQKA